MTKFLFGIKPHWILRSQRSGSFNLFSYSLFVIVISLLISLGSITFWRFHLNKAHNVPILDEYRDWVGSPKPRFIKNEDNDQFYDKLNKLISAVSDGRIKPEDVKTLFFPASGENLKNYCRTGTMFGDSPYISIYPSCVSYSVPLNKKGLTDTEKQVFINFSDWVNHELKPLTNLDTLNNEQRIASVFGINKQKFNDT